MDIELSKLIIPAIAGLISGAIGSLIAPWVNWGVEKNKLAHANKENLIKEIRAILSNPDITSLEFRNHPTYSRIKPYLSANGISAVEGNFSGPYGQEAIVIVDGSSRHGGVNPFRNQILDEITHLERVWKII